MQEEVEAGENGVRDALGPQRNPDEETEEKIPDHVLRRCVDVWKIGDVHQEIDQIWNSIDKTIGRCLKERGGRFCCCG